MNLLKSKICLSISALVFFTGTALAQDLQISDYDEVQDWTERYEQTQDQEIRGHIYGSEALYQLMAQPGVTKIKIYNALDQNGLRKIVFKGVDFNESEVGLAYDISKSCPPLCGGGGITTPVEQIGEAIDLSDAQMMVSNFYLAYPNEAISYTYEVATFKTLLTQHHAAGLFLAYGIDDINQAQLILMGITSEGNILDEIVGINADIEYNRSLTSRK